MCRPLPVGRYFLFRETNKMKRFLPGTAALAALCLSIPASAADLPARVNKAPPALVSPAYDWSGFYLGVSAGYTFGDDEDITTTGQAAANITNVAIGARPGRVRLERDGFIGGGQMGYNWQVSPNWVFGLEADISYVDVRRDVTVVGISAAGAPLNNTFRTRMDYLGTVRGRIGYAWDRTLIYATGGLAYAEIENSVNFFGPAGQLQFTGNNRRTEAGYTVGAGIEHAFAPNWTVKAEYLFYDLRDNTVNVAVIPGSNGAGTGYNSRFENDGHIVRAGLNYKFGGPGPGMRW
jgi:outer membrane immunogenic protein